VLSSQRSRSSGDKHDAGFKEKVRWFDESFGSCVAGHVGLSGVIFGATILAAATALPELSTGIAAVKLGDYQLAVSDIFGGNAFLPVVFLLACFRAQPSCRKRSRRTST
jgi:cation:H+ antiporter